MKTLYAADLDGTLLNEKGRLSEFTVTVLNAFIEKGLNFTVNTSRTPKSTARAIEGLSLKLPGITLSGGCFFDFNKNKVIKKTVMSDFDARAVVRVCRNAGVSPFLFVYDGDELTVEYLEAVSTENKSIIEKRKTYYKEFKKVRYFSYGGNVASILCVANENIIKTAADVIKRMPVTYTCHKRYDSDAWMLEVFPTDGSKMVAIKEYMEKYGFDRLVAFGDNLNDIEMLDFADTGIAVGNAHDEVLRTADLIIGANTDDAIAKYLVSLWAQNEDFCNE